MSLTLHDVQLDVPADVYDRAVAFWAEAVGATPRHRGGPYTHLVGARSLLGLHLQRLGSGDARVHLDLRADDPDAEVERLLELGATRVGVGPCTVLADPAGNLLCVCAGQDVAEELRAEQDGARLHVLVIDVPSDDVAATAAFWGEALGVAPEHLPAPYDPYWRLEDVPVPGGSMRILVQDIGAGATPRIHLDLHVPDPPARDSEVARLVALGATVHDEGTHPWKVLTDPVGTVLCVVPDRAAA